MVLARVAEYFSSSAPAHANTALLHDEHADGSHAVSAALRESTQSITTQSQQARPSIALTASTSISSARTSSKPTITGMDSGALEGDAAAAAQDLDAVRPPYPHVSD